MTGQPYEGRPQDMPVKAELPRLRVEYVKDSRLAFLGHLDLIATVERCIRRARLPFSIGNGFARRLRIQFTQALPVGASSSCEYFDLRLTEPIEAGEALERLRRATPPALAPSRAAYVPGRLPALEAWLDRSTWELEALAAPYDARDAERGVREVLERGELTYLRGEKEKRVDVAATLAGFEARDVQGGVAMTLDTRLSGCALRPQVLLDAVADVLGTGRPRALRVRRTAQAHEENGRLVEPFGPFDQTGGTPLS